MRSWPLFAAATLFIVPQMAWPQAHQPYSGLEARPIKALSDQQIADLKAGRGMGMALAAELNGYPGPLHVLELAEPLQLTDEQHQRMRELTEQMKAEAVPAGEKLIARERALDQAFASQSITPVTLSALTAQIGETQGEL